jgi:hypothetical protein
VALGYVAINFGKRKTRFFHKITICLNVLNLGFQKKSRLNINTPDSLQTGCLKMPKQTEPFNKEFRLKRKEMPTGTMNLSLLDEYQAKRRILSWTIVCLQPLFKKSICVTQRIHLDAHIEL